MKLVCEERLIPTALEVPIPFWDKAVDTVRSGKILNEFNHTPAGTGPGNER